MKLIFCHESWEPRLRVGDVFPYNGVTYVVEMVNDCRARCVSRQRHTKTIKGKFDEKAREVSLPYGALSISPNSEVDILLRLGQGWRSKKHESVLEKGLNAKINGEQLR